MGLVQIVTYPVWTHPGLSRVKSSYESLECVQYNCRSPQQVGQKENAKEKQDGFHPPMWSRDSAFLQARWPMLALLLDMVVIFTEYFTRYMIVVRCWVECTTVNSYSRIFLVLQFFFFSRQVVESKPRLWLHSNFKKMKWWSRVSPQNWSGN